MSAPALDVLCIGNAIVDVLSHVDDGFLAAHGGEKGTMRAVGEDDAGRLHALLPDAAVAPGGSGANTAVGAAMLGARAAFIGKVARDAAGDLFGEGLRRAGVAHPTAPADTGPATSRCIVLVTPDGERTMSTYIGACNGLGPADVDAALVASASHLLVEGYLWDVPSCREACLAAMAEARRAGRAVAVTLSDPGCVARNRAGFLDLAMGGADIVFANRREMLALFPGASEADALAALSRCPALGVVTRSERGVALTRSGGVAERPAHPARELVDTTGAGDMFAAGFLAGLSAGMGHAASADLAAFSATQVIQKLGATPPADIAALREAGGPAAVRDPTEPTRWMVVHVDVHGTGGIVAEDLGEEEARDLADAYERRGHHQAYLALPYTAATRAQVLRRERVLP